MAYKLIITHRADELLDERVAYLLFKLKNEQAAAHLLDEIGKVYDRLEDNPSQFPDCRDSYLKRMGYKEAVVTDMNYLVIFRIEEQEVYVVGVFHGLEDYKVKL